jgi:hypothetical protein
VTASLHFHVAVRGPAHTLARRAGAVNNWVRRGAGLSLHAGGSWTKWSHVGAVAFNELQRESCFHTRRRAPPLHSARQGFENTGICSWLCRWSANFGRLSVVYCRIVQISRLNFACAGPLVAVEKRCGADHRGFRKRRTPRTGRRGKLQAAAIAIHFLPCPTLLEMLPSAGRRFSGGLDFDSEPRANPPSPDVLRAYWSLRRAEQRDDERLGPVPPDSSEGRRVAPEGRLPSVGARDNSSGIGQSGRTTVDMISDHIADLQLQVGCF